ncbi:MAG TPA: L,D-transpeptidase/peptidoglycan binding protein [Solirubrobacteraceae bacterium]|nr:L,D-transpeptidase/peptidoglycan binding protein [Solirubrobacteraceae bacterium]
MRSPQFIVVAVFLTLLFAGAGAVWAYDASRDDRIADGVKAGGIMLGGLGREEARRKLESELVSALRRPVVVRARRKRFRLSAERAQVKADVDAMVDEALERSRRGNVVERTWRSLTGGEVEADIEPRITYDEDAVRALVRRIDRTTERDPVDAKVDFRPDGVKVVKSRHGIAMDWRNLEAKIQTALEQPDRAVRTVQARVRMVQPKVGTKEVAKKYPVLITIDRASFKLRLFKKLKLVKEYGIAVGMVGLETPAGLYNVQNKAVNPAWSVPNSAWAGDLAGQVIPGGTPQNPLKARWLGIYNGAGIHGTDATYSIGTNASHGCIRMLIPDVIELYDQVPVGAPVYIA